MPDLALRVFSFRCAYADPYRRPHGIAPETHKGMFA
jgi:hypothetical protein